MSGSGSWSGGRLEGTAAYWSICLSCHFSLDSLNLVQYEAGMQTVNIHEAKTHLSRLVDQAAYGEPFVIAKAGKPLVKVVPLTAPEASQMKRTGFLAGQIKVPDDFDRMGATEIESMFENGK